MSDETKENFDLVPPFEPLYEDVKTDRNKIWFMYEEKIQRLVGWLGWMKSFDKNELLQQAYIYFTVLCEAYDPYYDGKFFKFDRYLFKNLIIKLRAYIQNYYLKGKREQPVDITEKHDSAKICDDIGDTEEKIFIDYIYSMLDERQRDILEYTYQGYKQQEVGEILNISQSRVSVIKKKTLKILQDVLAEEEAEDNDKK